MTRMTMRERWIAGAIIGGYCTAYAALCGIGLLGMDALRSHKSRTIENGRIRITLADGLYGRTSYDGPCGGSVMNESIGQNGILTHTFYDAGRDSRATGPYDVTLVPTALGALLGKEEVRIRTFLGGTEEQRMWRDRYNAQRARFEPILEQYCR